MKKNVLFLFFLQQFTINVFAQKEQVLNYPKYDKRKVHFGFCLGVNNLNFHIKRQANFLSQDSLRNANAISESGLNLNIVSDFSLSEHLNLRILPGLSLASRKLKFNFYDSLNNYKSSQEKTVSSTLLTLPILLKYKSKRLNNMRGYVILGIEYDYDISSARNLKKQFVNDEVRIKANQLSATIGYGFDFYTNYFKFSPEFRYGIGLNNIQIKDPNIFSNSINGLLTKYWQINLYFE